VSAPLYRAGFWLGVVAVVILALMLLQGMLLPFAVSFVLAYLLVPLVDRLEIWKVRRSLGSLLVLALFFVGLGLVLLLIVPLLEAQIIALISALPRLVGVLQGAFAKAVLILQQHLPKEDVSKLRDLVSTKLADVLGWVASLFQSMITSSFAILNVVFLVVVTPVVTFFLLRDWHIMMTQIDAHLPRQPLDTIHAQARIIAETLAGFIYGQALVSLILAAYYTAALSAAGLESALAVGILIGVLSIIPVVGVGIGFILAVALAGLQYQTWTSVFIVCGIFLFGQMVEANFLTPKIVGDRIHLHPVWVIFAVLAGGTLFGIIGALLAVPAAAVIGVLVRFALGRYRRSPLYGTRPIEAVREREPAE
jgi:predicted PurR-regulated permease PerM